MAETQTTNGVEVLETREWLDSLDYVLVAGRPGAGRTPAAATLAACPSRRRRQPSLYRDHSLPEHDSFAAAAAISRQPGNGAPHQEPGALERPGHGGAGQQNRERHRRTYFDLRLGGHALRSRVQSFSAGANRIRRPRPGLFPGPRRARHVCAGFSRRPHSEREAGELPPRTESRRRPFFLSPSLADARLLGISHGLHGTGADPGHLPGALHSLSGKSRT